MAISNAIQDLKDRVLSAYGACEEKGAELPDVKNTANLPDCIRSISGGSPTPSPASYEDVCKEVEFCQNKLQELGGKSIYAGAWIGLRYSGVDYEDFTLGSSNVVAVRTSDGAFYSYANDGANVTHHWDNSKDFDIEGIATAHKFNWVIYYFSADSIVSNSSYLDCAKVVNIVYVFDMDLKFRPEVSGATRNTYGLSQHNVKLQSFDFVNEHSCYGDTATNFSRFCYYCESLIKLPDGLDTNKGTDFSNFCGYCYSLTKLPDSLDTSKGTNFSYFCSNSTALTQLPESLDTSCGTNFSYFCYHCHSLLKLPDGFDSGSGTNFSYFCGSCYSLTKLPDSIDTGSGTNFSSFCANGQSLTKLPDGLDTRNGTNFNNFCGCSQSLTKLPDGLDTSKGTNFSYFCYYCFALTKLPDILDTNKGTGFSEFCTNCYSLTDANIILPTSNITTINSSNRLTVASMRYIADHAPTVSGKKLTIGSTNIARANKYDPTIITTLTSKGWTVN